MGGIRVIKRYAIIINGVVVNVAIAENPLAENWVLGETASIGDLFADGVFTKPEIIEE
jgi:hypothetical protein